MRRTKERKMVGLLVRAMKPAVSTQEQTMTRHEFDRLYAATQDNTEGYTDAQLATINDAVFDDVQHLDPIDNIKSIVDHAFERAFEAADHRALRG